jgi:hypothetical protein
MSVAAASIGRLTGVARQCAAYADGLIYSRQRKQARTTQIAQIKSRITRKVRILTVCVICGFFLNPCNLCYPGLLTF